MYVYIYVYRCISTRGILKLRKPRSQAPHKRGSETCRWPAEVLKASGVGTGWYIDLYTYTHTYIYIYVYEKVRMHVHTYMRIHTYIYIYMYTLYIRVYVL